MIIDEIPSKVGQRVVDVFVSTRGWVRELGERNGTKVAVVEWDNPEPSIGDDDSVFPVDALRVVKHISLDLDLYQDPSLHPAVQQVTTGTEYGTVYRLEDGTVIKGIDLMRTWLLGYHEKA